MKAAFGAVLALVLVMRLLAPVGFMPDFAGDTLSSVACPDAGAPTPAVHHSHHHGQPKKTHSPCPYAAGGAAASLTDAATQLLVILFGAALLDRLHPGRS